MNSPLLCVEFFVISDNFASYSFTSDFLLEEKRICLNLANKIGGATLLVTLSKSLPMYRRWCGFPIVHFDSVCPSKAGRVDLGRNEKHEHCYLPGFVQGTVLGDSATYFLKVFYFFVSFGGMVSCGLGWPQTCYVAEDGIKLWILLPLPFAGMTVICLCTCFNGCWEGTQGLCMLGKHFTN